MTQKKIFVVEGYACDYVIEMLCDNEADFKMMEVTSEVEEFLEKQEMQQGSDLAQWWASSDNWSSSFC